jgi:(p)ppGpp synthase/HD superfamily hydrolase
MTIIANDVLRLSRALDYAAQKHSAQRRKGVAQEPYINHLSEVALLLAEATDGRDTNLIIAGLLHDCIEDQGVTHDELVAQFGDDIADLVRECTDDKSLPKAERKRLQVANAPHKSERARMLKLADKTSNLRSVRLSPPAHWDAKRRADYFIWAQEVVTACGDVSPYLLEKFEEAYKAGAG